MREKNIEISLRDAVKAKGGLCWKFVSPGTVGVPDRIILMPKGQIVFVETKATGEKPRKIQLKRHRQLKALGFHVYVLDDKEKITELIYRIGSDED
ncbi:MAG: VRR-NUC domain-containing protein [Ruminococcus sp.]|nr:VRR-NUC domain-containing protein [Ruminococcus sp.]